MSVTHDDISISELLGELEKMGVNVTELRKLYNSGANIGLQKENLIKLLEAHLFQRAFKENLAA